jgi:hypothetical protein
LWTSKLQEIAVSLGYQPNDVQRLTKSVQQTTDELTKKWLKLGLYSVGGLALGAVTLGAAAPAVALAIGASAGLSGAAAFTFGMATLGSLVGGGMFGGSVVMLGGGAILGVAGGGAAGGTAGYLSERQLAVEVVKLEVVLKEIVLQQKDMATYLAILEQQRVTIHSYEVEIDRLRLDSQTNADQIKKLEKAVEVLRNSLRRMQENANGVGGNSN